MKHWHIAAFGGALVCAAALLHCASKPAPQGSTTPGAEQPANAAASAPAGVYALTQALSPVPDWVLSHPDVSGVVVRGQWPDFERAEGQFDFQYLDRELARVASANKAASLVVTSGGRATPDWLMAKTPGVFRFTDENQFHASYGQSVAVPLFWDAQLLAHKKRLIAELGRRYAGQPALRRVSAQCANATTDDWNVPGSPAAVEEWKRVGFSEDRLFAACREIVDATMHAFPNQLVRMAVGRVPPELGVEPQSLAKRVVAYANQRYPGRFIVQRHNLSAPTPRASDRQLFGWEVIRDAPLSAAQFLWPAADTKSCRLDRGQAPCDSLTMFRRSVDTALTYRLRYVEVYASDLNKAELGAEVKRLAQGLAGVVSPAAPQVAPPAAAPAAPAAAPAGTAATPSPRGPRAKAASGPLSAQELSFTGPITGKNVEYTVHLPASYGSGTERYPVVYWLHGKGGDNRRSSRVADYFSNAMQAAQFPESIVVFPNGGRESFYTDSPDGNWPIETMLVQELIPHIDAKYRTIAERSGRLIVGFSMGGFGALKLASKYPDRFAGVLAYGAPRLDASLGMGGQDAEIFQKVFNGDSSKFEANTPAYLFRSNKARVQQNKLAVRLVAGSEDGTRISVQKLHEVLTELGVAHEYEMLPNVRHVPANYYDAENGAGFRFLYNALSARQ